MGPLDMKTPGMSEKRSGEGNKSYPIEGGKS